MNSEELKKRTKKFAVQIIEAVKTFPRTMPGEVVGRQIVRSATSVGANYRSRAGHGHKQTLYLNSAL
jgi:four helix bundle protein